jgi:hypothetical protein
MWFNFRSTKIRKYLRPPSIHLCTPTHLLFLGLLQLCDTTHTSAYYVYCKHAAHTLYHVMSLYCSFHCSTCYNRRLEPNDMVK